MFIGHFGVGLAAKRLAPRTSLGTLFFAAQFLDLIWPIFLLLGLEHVWLAPGVTAVSPLDFYDYPISHSLATALVWSAATGIIYFLFTRYRRGALVVGVHVLSHWILDAIVHRPDLPLIPGGRTRVGLGLWNSWSASIAVESVFFVAGLWLYHNQYTSSGQNRDDCLVVPDHRIGRRLDQQPLGGSAAESTRTGLGSDGDVVDRSVGMVGGQASREPSQIINEICAI